MSRDFALEGAIAQIKSTLETSFLVSKHKVTDNTDDNDDPQIRVRIFLTDMVNSVSELTNLIRDLRKKTPRPYSVKLEIRTVL